MSLEALHTEVASYRAQAGELAEQFMQDHARVTADGNLTTTGRREQLEPLHREMTDQLRALHAREKAAVKAEKERLERKAYGLSPSASNDPARVVSYRDAQSRARQLEDADAAEEIYQSALRSGDSILATAVLERALVRGWSSIKTDYLNRNPGTRNDLDDLEALARYTDNGLMNAVHYMTPDLNLPFSSGMPDVPPLNSIGKPQGVRPLPAGFGTKQ